MSERIGGPCSGCIMSDGQPHNHNDEIVLARGEDRMHFTPSDTTRIESGWCPVCQETIYECVTCRNLMHGETERDEHRCTRSDEEK